MAKNEMTVTVTIAMSMYDMFKLFILKYVVRETKLGRYIQTK